MRTSVPFILALPTACAPDGQTATVGECPEGSELNDAGECEEEIGSFSNDEEGDITGDGEEDDDSDDGDDDSGDSDENDDEVPEDLEPLEEDVTGFSYAIDLSTGVWVKPSPLIGGLLGDALDVQVLMSVEEATDETLDLVGALPDTDSEELVQDVCLPTLDFDPIDFSDSPYFRVGPTNFPIELMGFSLTIWDMDISGIFESDGEGMTKIGLAGTLDVREIGEALGDTEVDLPVDLSDPDSTCDLLASIPGIGVECEDCPSDDEPYCIAIELEEITAEKVEATVEPITEDEIDADCE